MKLEILNIHDLLNFKKEDQQDNIITGVYIIKYKKNYYVGQSIDIKRRLYTHIGICGTDSAFYKHIEPYIDMIKLNLYKDIQIKYYQYIDYNLPILLHKEFEIYEKLKNNNICNVIGHNQLYDQKYNPTHNNYIDKETEILIYECVIQNNKSSLLFLIKNFNNIRILNECLLLAIISNHIDIVNILLSNDYVNPNYSSDRPMIYALRYKNIEIIKLLYQHPKFKIKYTLRSQLIYFWKCQNNYKIV